MTTHYCNLLHSLNTQTQSVTLKLQCGQSASKIRSVSKPDIFAAKQSISHILTSIFTH